MLDLETLSLSSNALVLSIGAVRFDPVSGTVRDYEYEKSGGAAVTGGMFYRVVSIKSGQLSGGEIDGNTVAWWMTQSDAARAAVFGDGIDTQPIETVLKEFSAWVREVPCSGMWGNGAGYDNVVLGNAYRRLGWTQPWSYEEDRCYRTVARLNPEVERDADAALPGFIAHHALWDAISQARHLVKILKSRKKGAV